MISSLGELIELLSDALQPEQLTKRECSFQHISTHVADQNMFYKVNTICSITPKHTKSCHRNPPVYILLTTITTIAAFGHWCYPKAVRALQGILLFNFVLILTVRNAMVWVRLSNQAESEAPLLLASSLQKLPTARPSTGSYAVLHL